MHLAPQHIGRQKFRHFEAVGFTRAFGIIEPPARDAASLLLPAWPKHVEILRQVAIGLTKFRIFNLRRHLRGITWPRFRCQRGEKADNAPGEMRNSPLPAWAERRKLPDQPRSRRSEQAA